MIAVAINYKSGGNFLPIENRTPNYNMIIPVMLGRYFPAGLLGIGFTAPMASFMSGSGKPLGTRPRHGQCLHRTTHE